MRSNLTNEDPATLWQYYMQLTEIEQAFKELKHDLAMPGLPSARPDRSQPSTLQMVDVPCRDRSSPEAECHCRTNSSCADTAMDHVPRPSVYAALQTL